MRKFPLALLTIGLSVALTACSLPVSESNSNATTAVGIVMATDTTTTSTTETTATTTTATQKKSTTTKKKATTTKKKTTTTKAPTTTKTPVTTKPVHQHSYTNYVCTGCGAIDKAHSFGYLCNWLVENGTVQGDHTSIAFNPKAGDTSLYCNVTIMYYPETRDINECIAIHYYEQDHSSQIFFIAMLFLYEDYSDCSYIAEGGLYEVEEYHVDGYIPIAKHTQNRPISCETCELAFPYETEWDMLDGVRIDINNALCYAAQLLKNQKVGITLADLGFTAF